MNDADRRLQLGRLADQISDIRKELIAEGRSRTDEVVKRLMNASDELHYARQIL